MGAPSVGIVGAGQLGRMMALAAYPLGIECRFVDTSADSPGGRVGAIRVAPLDDAAALEALAREVDVLTFDIENVSTDILSDLQRLVRVHPNPEAVAAAQDRLTEKAMFTSLGIPTVPYLPIESEASLTTAAHELGLPLVLKTRRLGYDGRGQRIVSATEELAPAWEALSQAPAIAEAYVQFDRELSLIGVRGVDGSILTYPLTENVHANGILRSSVAPYPNAELQTTAQDWMSRLMDRFDYVGVLTIELFETRGQLLANEIAPRVHNSGHWTIEGAETSQFENHIRAVLELPLGSTAARGHSAMVNLLGEMPDKRTLLAMPGVHLHDYCKSPRPARKIGHCTIVDDDRGTLVKRLEKLQIAVCGLADTAHTERIVGVS